MSKRSGKRLHRHIGGRIGWWKGKVNEERFFSAFTLESFEKPSWFKGVRRGTPNEDNRGIDFVIETYTKPERIFIQIKSSKWGKCNFWKKHLSSEFEFPLVVLVLDVYCRDCGKVRRLFFETIKINIGLD